VERLGTQIDPYANDPGHWGASLLTLAELILPCLDAAGARSVVEVGAYAGDLTRALADWASRSGASVQAIDPDPRPALVELAERRPELELIRETSLAALGRVARPDVAIIDGDHNYYTVSEELRLIAGKASGADLPLLMFHDVEWPHARRDDYYDPGLVPEEHRQPIAHGAGLFPGEPGVRPGGLPYRHAASREGGPRNGVLTAVEDFVARDDGLVLVVIPAFFGLGVVWHRGAPWGAAVAQVLEQWDRNPLLGRLEANRVLHLASSHFHLVAASRAHERVALQEALLRRLLDSRAFALAERLSRLRARAGVATDTPVISRNAIRRAIGE
jgi:Methyltransferase domain